MLPGGRIGHLGKYPSQTVSRARSDSLDLQYRGESAKAVSYERGIPSGCASFSNHQQGGFVEIRCKNGYASHYDPLLALSIDNLVKTYPNLWFW